MDKYLQRTYSEINDNIKFSEAKNAALITLNSALIGVSVDKVFDYQIALHWRVVVLFASVVLLIPLIISLYSFRAATGSERGITKLINKIIESTNNIPIAPKKLMYYSYIIKNYKEDPIGYLKAVNEKDTYTIDEIQYATQIVNLSGVAYRKFILFNFAIKIESMSFVFGVLSGIVILVLKIF